MAPRNKAKTWFCTFKFYNNCDPKGTNIEPNSAVVLEVNFRLHDTLGLSLPNSSKEIFEVTGYLGESRHTDTDFPYCVMYIEPEASPKIIYNRELHLSQSKDGAIIVKAGPKYMEIAKNSELYPELHNAIAFFLWETREMETTKK